MNPLRSTSGACYGVADQFASEWIAAWNAHDLDRIVSHYRDDVLFMSPFAARDGVLRGLPALRNYFERALAVYKDLHFEPIAALSGVNSIALHYRSIEGREAIEVMELDARRHVHRAAAHYTAAPTKRTQMTSCPDAGGARRSGGSHLLQRVVAKAQDQAVARWQPAGLHLAWTHRRTRLQCSVS